MSEMIERVAVAVRTAFTDAELNNPRISFEELTDILARAAIEAMREPTETMILPGYDALMEWDARTGEDNGIADIWSAMVDSALSTHKAENRT